MKNFVMLLIAVLVLSGRSVYAQKTDTDNLGEITFEELKDKDKTSQYFAVGGGFFGNFLLFDNAKINAALPAEYKVGDVGKSLFISGGQGFVTFFFKNFRFGFSAGIGTQTISKTDTIAGTTPVYMKRQVDFSSSFNGLTIDYAIPIVKDLTILPGFEVGFGTTKYERYDGVSNVDFTNIKPDTLAVNSNIAASRWFIQPCLNIEYALTTFTMLRVNVGYNLTFVRGDWTKNRTTIIAGVPNELHPDGLVAGFGLFFGLFRNE